MKRNIDTIIIHCADTPNGVPVYDIEDIAEWHAERGFSEVGYHYVIKTDGEIQKGRKLKKKGSHARGRNKSSIGICLIGRDKFTISQWEFLRDLVIELTEKFGPEIAVIGHREINPKKDCPGFCVPSWLLGAMAPLAGHILE